MCGAWRNIRTPKGNGDEILTNDHIRPLIYTTHIQPTAMSSIAFILGAGAHVGLAIANKFKQEGYRVAVGSRKPLQQEGLVPITVDVSNAGSVTKAFAEVKERFGSAPNVVINGSSRSIASDYDLS